MKNHNNQLLATNFFVMKYKYTFLTSVLALLLSAPFMLNGQNTNLDDNDKCYYQWYLNANGGFSQSYCDLQNGSWHLNMLNKDELDWGYGFRLGKHLSPVFTLYGSLIKSPLKGIMDEKVYDGNTYTNMKFESELMDYILGTTVNFSNLVFGYNAKRRLTVYGTTGIGMVYFRAKAMSPDTVVSVFGYKKTGPNTVEDDTKVSETMIPTGIGADFKISNRWDVNLETTIRWFDSDKLDGLIAGDLKDAYYFTSLGLSYNFLRPKERCKLILETDQSILALHGDSIPVEIKGTMPCFNPRAVLDFTPVLKYGDKSVKLKTIYLQGNEVEEEFRKAGAIEMAPTGGTFVYRTMIKYEPGMEICALYADPLVSVKGKTPFSLLDRKVADGLIMTAKRVQNNEEFLAADHKYVKEKLLREKSVILYIVNRSDLRWDYYLNKEEKARTAIATFIEFMKQGLPVKEVAIDAWASPEGEESYNQGLSEKRVETAKKWFESEYSKYIKERSKSENVDPATITQVINYNLNAKGEDWDGFMQSVQDSEIKDKNSILNIVNNQSDIDQREQEIRNMTVIYKEIEKDILPPLRRAELTLVCYEPTRLDEEILQLALSGGQGQGIEEMLYAATLTTDMDQQLTVYKNTCTQYPGEWRAFNNTGFVQAKLGKYDEAKKSFDKARSLSSTQGIVLNNCGAVEARQKNFSKAKTDYLAAQKQGTDIGYNLGIIKIIEGNYSGALSSFGARKCDYNVALAQLLGNNYNAAINTLNCTTKTGEVYYLMAIAGARTANDNMVYENLKKALEEDPKYRQQALDDREFIRYFNNPDFQSALR